MTSSGKAVATRQFWLRVKSTLASLYFASMFFVLGPAAVLYLSRQHPWQLGTIYAVVPGVVLIVAANLWVVRLVGQFIRFGDGTHVPIDPPRRFVATDSYRWTRNPMYSAYVVIAIGEALLFQSVALVFYASTLWLIAHLYVVFREEPLLAERFGDSYRQYLAQVPRWGLPPVCVEQRRTK